MEAGLPGAGGVGAGGVQARPYPAAPADVRWGALSPGGSALSTYTPEGTHTAGTRTGGLTCDSKDSLKVIETIRSQNLIALSVGTWGAQSLAGTQPGARRSPGSWGEPLLA